MYLKGLVFKCVLWAEQVIGGICILTAGKQPFLFIRDRISDAGYYVKYSVTWTLLRKNSRSFYREKW